MSISRIPDKYLNTTLHIIRDVSTIDDVGDAETIRELAYGSVKAHLQPSTGRGSSRREIGYEVHGKVHIQTHRAYFNRFEDGERRIIESGDYAIDLETMKHYLVLAALEYQAADVSLDDTHHYKLILATTDGRFDVESSTTVSSKANIV